MTDNVIDFNKARRLNFYQYSIPDLTKASIERYILDRIAPGGFLQAVFANDLVGAVSHASGDNAGSLVDIARWIANYAPGDCWGSYPIVQKYLNTPRIK